MRITVLVEDYPDSKRSVFPFVKQLVDEMANQGHIIQVVAPFSLTKNKRICKRKETHLVGKGCVTVYRPAYFSFSTLRIGKNSLTYLMLQKAFQRGLRDLDEKPDIVYGHFWHTASWGFKYAKRNSLPLFVASGESEIVFRADSIQKRAFCDYLSGVVCVSTKNKEESIALGLTHNKKCIVLPNAIDNQMFRKLNKMECRTRLGFPEDAFIVIFVGWFIERKGANRVASALSKIKEGRKIFSVFIGKGDEDPNHDNLLFKGTVQHNEVPIFLNASDIFVLPTLHEGCCNAIVEAMACGLPVISSDLPFNKDICNDTNSILVDPMDIESIRDAIVKLRDDDGLYDTLSKGALRTGEILSIEKRASSIIEFLNKRIQETTKE